MLAQQIERVIRQTVFLERSALITTGVIWSWLVSLDDSRRIVDLAWFLPLMITFFSIMRVWALDGSRKLMQDYLKQVENNILQESEVGGWRNYRDEMKNFKNPWGFGFIGLSALAYWIILFLVNLLVPTIKICGVF